MKLLGLRRAIILARAIGVMLIVFVVIFAINFLLKVRNPLVEGRLCLYEAFSNILLDDGKVIYVS